MMWKETMTAGLLAVATTARAERPFLVLDNAFKTCEEEQALLLKRLGYAGMCTRPARANEALYALFDEHELKIMATYVTPKGDARDLSANVVKHIESLKDRKTLIWLMVRGRGTSDDAAVGIIRKVCDLAAANGLEVALYPHVGCCTDTVENCTRLLRLADRSNLGVSFNLCHFLRQNDEDRLEATIRSVAPHLKLVQINGASKIPAGGKKDWKMLIQPLGNGDFDVGRVLRTLDEIGYTGPVALQCYNVSLPAEEHLTKSMNAWKKLTREQ